MELGHIFGEAREASVGQVHWRKENKAGDEDYHWRIDLYTTVRWTGMDIGVRRVLSEIFLCNIHVRIRTWDRRWWTRISGTGEIWKRLRDCDDFTLGGTPFILWCLREIGRDKRKCLVIIHWYSGPSEVQVKVQWGWILVVIATSITIKYGSHYQSVINKQYQIDQSWL